MISSIPLRTTVGYSLQASKWQKLPLLIDADEMQALLDALGQFWMVQIIGLISIGQEIIDQEAFLEVYRHYLEAIKKGENPTDPHVRSYFSSVLTTSLDALYAVKVNEEQC